MYNKRNTLEERIHIVRKTLSLFVAVAGLSFGAPTITIIPSIGPVPVSPNYNTYNSNALTALLNNATSFGVAGPGQYNRLTGLIDPSHIIDTTGAFNSWLGVANPAAPFNSEFGNRLYFGMRVLGANGADTFTLNDLIVNNSIFTSPTIPVTFNTSSDTYDGTFILGVQYGGNGALGGGDDVLINSNESRFTPVNALFYRGFYFAAGFDPSDPAYTGTDAQRLTAFANDVRDYIAGEPSQGITGEIKNLAAGSFETSFTSSIPEPSTYALMGLGLIVLAFARHRAS